MEEKIDMNNFSNAEKEDSRSDNDKSAAEKLIQILSSEQLSQMESIFKNGKYSEGMKMEEFSDVMRTILDNNDKLCLEFFDLYSIDGHLTWNVTLNGLISTFPSSYDNRIKLEFIGINKNNLTKRDSIAKILIIETTTHFCYTVYSKYGKTGIYDANFVKLATYFVIMTREDINKPEKERRRRNRWITDAVYLQDLKKIVVINTARSIIVYDVVGLKHTPIFLVLSTPNIPKCIAYKYGKNNSDRHLFIGDDGGSILVLSFVHNKDPLFRTKHKDKLSLHYWEKLMEEKEYVKISYIKKVHNDVIREISYCREDDTLTTCSRDPKASVIRIFLDHKKPTMIYEMPKGTSTMCFSKKLNILITGSSDGTIRLWNTLVITNAIAVLKENESGIKSIILMETPKMFVSCDNRGVLKLWSIEEQKCFQTIHLNFPPLQEAGKIVDWATKCMFLGPKEGNIRSSSDPILKRPKEQEVSSEYSTTERSIIWISCCNYIASVSLIFKTQELKKQFEMLKLEPPPKQNNVFIPSTWLLSEESFKELREKIDCDIEYPEKFKDYEYIRHKKVMKRMERITKINQKIAVLDHQKREMQENVARNAPYLSLKLFDIEELKISRSLATHGKEERTIMEKTQNLLIEASNKDIVFSELSSSRSRSSRSSVMEFEY
ncbi:WD repeat-containing protein on Y chromosome-like isoform X2 [Harmonia axyridis]|uniref:WD repeat-containing protein on Y chromosome-like isoform X2 n=1 Tax=Harmonia axyridis TaxID=115357 RepID=UPI001E276FE5|nr:WD repeat-containing protein on Y chromosome-like isoform X2 [Harmonia axyridis]